MKLTRRLLAFHRVSGLVLSLLVVFFSVTGLILLFHPEIDDLLGQAPVASEMGDIPTDGFSRSIDAALKAHPNQRAMFVFQTPE
ncbi:MAG: PepSY domain-containing protein, partial [Myxococcota bacterium]